MIIMIHGLAIAGFAGYDLAIAILAIEYSMSYIPGYR